MVRSEPIGGANGAGVDRAQPAKAQAYEYVRREILREAIDTPHFLSEEHVGRELGLSRTPVREAFLMLEAEGFLQLVPRKGALVVPITERQVREVMQVRSVVESWSLTQVLADEGLRARLLVTLHALQDDLEAIGDDDATASIECDRRFHREIIAAAGNQVLLDLYERMRDLQLRMGVRAVLDDSARAQAVRREHRNIIDALAGGRGDRVLAALSEHLEITAQSLHHRVGGS
jgi:DNA-binding GntR family transcriptional regulator